MTITVREDQIDGFSFGLTANGPVATRVFTIIADEGETAPTILLDVNVPQYFDQYPGLSATGSFAMIYALEFDLRPRDRQRGIWSLQVNYSRPDAAQNNPGTSAADSVIQVGSSVSAARTNLDNAGDEIVVTLAGQPDQLAEVDIQLPQTVIQFERRESVSPLANSLAYVGRVNSVGIGSLDVGTLLCLGIDGTSADNGLTWQVTYRFQYNPDTWTATVVYIDPETDRPAEGVNYGTSAGVVYADVYPTADFTALDLDW